MRKIIAILVGLLMLFSIPALGEDIDFSTMDIDSLLVIRDRAQQEIALRTDENIVIWSIQLGEYVCLQIQTLPKNTEELWCLRIKKNSKAGISCTNSILNRISRHLSS